MNEHCFGNDMSWDSNGGTNTNPTTIHGEMSQRSIELDDYVDKVIAPDFNQRGGDLWNRVKEFMLSNTLKEITFAFFGVVEC